MNAGQMPFGDNPERINGNGANVPSSVSQLLAMAC